VTSFTWTSPWEQQEGVWSAQFGFRRTDYPSVVTSAIVTAFSVVLKIDTTWIKVNILMDGGYGSDSIATLSISEPGFSPSDPVGYVDVLFFSGTTDGNEELTCRIHDICESNYYTDKRYCYNLQTSNLVGEYSGDNHILEQACTPGINLNWGNIQVNINKPRTGGTYRMMCDSSCYFCRQEGTFEGDECICFVEQSTSIGADGFTYYCISVKFAASSLTLPSIVTLLVFVLRILGL